MLLVDMSKDELVSLCIEQSADIGILINTKKKVLENNQDLAARVQILEKENAELIMILRRNGLM